MITGNQIKFYYPYKKQWVGDMNNKPEAEFIKLGYKTLFDFLRKKKSEYVRRAYALEQRSEYVSIMSLFFIIF